MQINLEIEDDKSSIFIDIFKYYLYYLCKHKKGGGNNMEPWISLIGSVGFPIVACIVMAFYVKEQNKNNREDVKELNAMHTKEMDAFKVEIKEALNNNTIALTKLCEKLDGGGCISEVK